MTELYKISEDKIWNFCLNILLDDSISEVEVNGPNLFFIKRSGRRIQLDNLSYPNEEAYREAIEKGLVPHIASEIPYDPMGYIYEGPLRYMGGDKLIRGRCHIVLPPAADSPQITIAKKSTALATLDDIASRGSMAAEMLEFVKASIQADLTTILSGGTGAGKALHKDTPIPTPNGFTTMGALKVGDEIFDETGARTKVLRKYCPLDPKSYEITFSTGEKMRASAGHLWAVTEIATKGKGRTPLKSILTDKQYQAMKAALEANPSSDLVTFQSFATTFEFPKNAYAAKNFFLKHGSRRPYRINKDELIVTLERSKTAHNAGKIGTLIEAVSSFDTDTVDYHQLRMRVPFRIESRFVGGQVPPIDSVLPFRKALELFVAEEEKRRLARQEFDAKPHEWKESILTTEEMALRGVLNARGRKNFAIKRLNGAVDYSEKSLPIDPYVLGAWLGDGISDRQSFCNTDVEIRDRIMQSYELTRELTSQKDYQTRVLYDWKFDSLRPLLRQAGLLGNKHIPADYIYSSRGQRIELISGLVDTDGSISPKGEIGFGSTNKQMVEAAREIVLSLGWKAYEIQSKIPYAVKPDGTKVAGKRAYFFGFIADELNLQVPHKKERFEARLAKIAEGSLSQQVRHNRIYIDAIAEVDDSPEDYFCIQVDSPSHLFLAGETFVPTHNTTFLEAMCKHIPLETRIGVAEDTPELALPHPNATYLHSVPWRPGMDEKDVATLSWVVAQFNRMRTDKLIIGETRGKEFSDFLVAANSGMDGSLTTIHANEPIRALDKMTNFALKGAPGTPIRAINKDIATSIDLIFQLAYFKADSRYRMTAIQEVTKTISTGDDAAITTATLYKYNPDNDTWVKESNPTDELRKRFALHGINITEICRSQPGTVLYAPGKGDTTAVSAGIPLRRV